MSYFLLTFLLFIILNIQNCTLHCALPSKLLGFWDHGLSLIPKFIVSWPRGYWFGRWQWCRNHTLDHCRWRPCFCRDLHRSTVWSFICIYHLQIRFLSSSCLFFSRWCWCKNSCARSILYLWWKILSWVRLWREIPLDLLGIGLGHELVHFDTLQIDKSLSVHR